MILNFKEHPASKQASMENVSTGHLENGQAQRKPSWSSNPTFWIAFIYTRTGNSQANDLSFSGTNRGATSRSTVSSSDPGCRKNAIRAFSARGQ